MAAVGQTDADAMVGLGGGCLAVALDLKGGADWPAGKVSMVHTNAPSSTAQPSVAKV